QIVSCYTENLFCFAQVLGAVKNAPVSILEVFERTKNNGEIFWSLVILKMNLQFELNSRYTEPDLVSAGFRRTKCIEQIAENDGVYRHESGNEIYVVRETPDKNMIPMSYHNLKTGECICHNGQEKK
ncbi:hypothetical protein HY450_03255, partial [Candidatus Pacearchaeota archaeon]|nr:hypothetical protein [Candidatus Pacearchaeota archaeon]